jgi:TolB-like protein/Tfp pilus assembly protein PilF
MDVRGFIAELKRRKVFRVATFYAFAAFVVAQVADILMPGLQLPDWSVTLVLALLILGFPISIALAWAFDVTPAGVVRTPSSVPPPALAQPTAADTRPLPSPGGVDADPADATRPARPAPSIRSVAVLPFADMSPDRDNEYFSDGLAEELLNALARLDGLRVPARTSSFAFKGRNVDIREIGRTLGVDAVLEGSVRKAGERLRITAQLIDVDDGYHRWSETFDRELSDVFAIQEEIARAIVGALGFALPGGRQPLVCDTDTDPEAYDLFFRGLHDFHTFVQGYSEERLREALARFEDSVRKDPNCAPAHAWHAVASVHLADDFLSPREVYPRARLSAERALELDPRLADAHAVHGAIKMFYDWDAIGAERALTRSLELNANSVLARIYYALLLSAVRRHEEAIRHARLALDIDPLGALAAWGLGWTLYRAGEFDAAAAHARGRIDVDPEDAVARLQLGASYLEQGRTREALQSIRHATTLAGEHQFYLALLAHAAARVGHVDEAQSLARRLEERSRERYVPPSEVAYAHVGLGDFDTAFHWLERGAAERDSMLLFLDVEPILAPLRVDSRFAGLRRRVGLDLPAATAGLVHSGHSGTTLERQADLG